jgi:hypothetical protein
MDWEYSPFQFMVGWAWRYEGHFLSRKKLYITLTLGVGGLVVNYHFPTVTPCGGGVLQFFNNLGRS